MKNLNRAKHLIIKTIGYFTVAAIFAGAGFSSGVALASKTSKGNCSKTELTSMLSKNAENQFCHRLSNTMDFLLLEIEKYGNNTDETSVNLFHFRSNAKGSFEKIASKRGYGVKLMEFLVGSGRALSFNREIEAGVELSFQSFNPPSTGAFFTFILTRTPDGKAVLTQANFGKISSSNAVIGVADHIITDPFRHDRTQVSSDGKTVVSWIPSRSEKGELTYNRVEFRRQ